jgi:sialidase-1
VIGDVRLCIFAKFRSELVIMNSLKKRTTCFRILQMLLAVLLSVQWATAQELNYLFKPGDHGYKCFRIPAVVRSKSGTILAFAEARKNHCGDADDIDLVMRSSSDGGKTWSPLSIVWDDGGNTCGNPAPVVDEKNGRIVLLSTWNLGGDHEPQIINQKSKDTRRIFVMHSDNEGKNWTKPREITTSVKKTDWTWYATGPCNGIQIRKGTNAGRLVIPCDHIEAGSKKYFSHAIYSDDGGNNWKLGGSTPTDQVNECTVAELPKGKLLLNMRNYNQIRFRQTSLSEDGGNTWSALRQDTSLPEPVCQASLIRLWSAGRKPVLAFSNPADQKSRVGMTVRWSLDEGNTWAASKLVHAGPSAYSNLVELSGKHLGLLFEGGVASAYEGIAWTILESSGR